MKKKLLTLFLVFIITTPSMAAWVDELDGFKWGMSPEEVREFEQRSIKKDASYPECKQYILYFNTQIMILLHMTL